MPRRPARRTSIPLLLLASLLGGLPAATADTMDPRWISPTLPPDLVPQVHPLPPLRVQAEEQQQWLAKRLTEVVPALMREHGVEMWILSMR
ncbi:MAG TPA: hypothetical protein VGQ28_13540, partial [Thermoanaerobaculia bacterium]|nr:hypothetical protein [Thermoanaerobaculia bacterium]